jgi:xanthine dehydrogenase iron-sulfur cluster and FAD-binding subunit A
VPSRLPLGVWPKYQSEQNTANRHYSISHGIVESIERAMVEFKKDFAPISDFRASADYRLDVSQNMLRRLYLELESNSQTIRVTQYA